MVKCTNISDQTDANFVVIQKKRKREVLKKKDAVQNDATTKNRRQVLKVNLRRLNIAKFNQNPNEILNSSKNIDQSDGGNKENNIQPKITYDEKKDDGKFNNKTYSNKRKSLTTIKKQVLPTKEFQKKEVFIKGEMVLAKMRGFVPWPAIIQDIRTSSVDVYFFGTHNFGTVNIKMISLLTDDTLKILSYLERPCYAKAVQEVEVLMGIPDVLSLMKH